MTEATPLQLMENNAKAQRASARQFRADAERYMHRAVEADNKAEEWEAAAKTLRDAGA